jgi:hypothetical protein
MIRGDADPSAVQGLWPVLARAVARVPRNQEGLFNAFDSSGRRGRAGHGPGRSCSRGAGRGCHHRQTRRHHRDRHPFGHSADDTPTISTKVNAEQILAAGGSSIADSLKDVPGVSASGFAAGASRPIIRGMDSARVRLLEDGTSASDVSDIGPDHGIPIDPLAARSIEVVRGAATCAMAARRSAAWSTRSTTACR